MDFRSVRAGHVYRWGSGYWRVVGRRGGRFEVEKVERRVAGDGAPEFVAAGPRERVRPGELRPL